MLHVYQQCLSWLVKSGLWTCFIRFTLYALKGMLLMGNSFSRHSWHAASRKPHLTSLNRMAFIRKQNPFAVVKFVVHSSLASARALHQRNASFRKLLLQTLLARCLKKTTPRFPEPHGIHQETKSFRVFRAIKLVVHSSLASCPGSSPKECSLWKTPSSDTPDTLPQENHTSLL